MGRRRATFERLAFRPQPWHVAVASVAAALVIVLCIAALLALLGFGHPAMVSNVQLPTL